LKSSPSISILVVEDEKDIAELMALHLKREGYQVTVVEDGEAGLKALDQNEYQLLVLDWMLPHLSGVELCKKLRQNGNQIPVLMVTARAHTSDIVLGLEMGADDYLTKPFDLPVLLARVRALLRRAQGANETSENEMVLGGLKIDTDCYQVTCDGQLINLTASEFKLLAALLGGRGRVLTRDQLIEMVQGEGVSVIDRAIDTHVFGLRKKLGGCSDLIETIRGVGYRVRWELP